MWKAQNKNWLNDIKLPFWRFLQQTFNWSEKMLRSSLIHHGIPHLSHGTLIWLDGLKEFWMWTSFITNISNSNYLDPKGHSLECDQNILELYFHVYGQLRQMNGEHANIRAFFLFFQILDFWWFFPKILTKLFELTIEKETFQKNSSFIVKKVTKFHTNAKYNEFFVAYSHFWGKKSLNFEGKK